MSFSDIIWILLWRKSGGKTLDVTQFIILYDESEFKFLLRHLALMHASESLSEFCLL